MKKPGAAFKLLYTERARRDISRLDPSIRRLVKNALEKISKGPFCGKPLMHSLKGYYSYRTSDYRIIYEINSGEVIVIVVAVGHRRDIYERLRGLLPKKGTARIKLK